MAPAVVALRRKRALTLAPVGLLESALTTSSWGMFPWGSATAPWALPVSSISGVPGANVTSIVRLSYPASVQLLSMTRHDPARS